MSNNATVRKPTADEREEQGNGRSSRITVGPDLHEVEERAYQLWVERGCPVGSPDEDWFRAEDELLHQQS